MNPHRRSLWTSAPLALVLVGACVDNTPPAPAEAGVAAAHAPAATALALTPEPEPDPDLDDTDDEVCEDEPDVAPPSHTVCFALQRGWAGTIGDASTTTDERARERGDLVVGGRDGAQALLWFDTAALPRDVVVTSATLDLGHLGGEASVDVHAITAPWDEREVTPDTRVRYAPEAAATLRGGARAAADLTKLVQAWLDGSAPNHGVALLTRDTATVTFAGSEARLLFDRPRLDVCLEPLKKGGEPGPSPEDFGKLVCADASPLSPYEVCPADLTNPTLHCTNVLVDELNCGACGKACGPDAMCAFGACVDATKADELCALAGKEVCEWPKTGQTTCENLSSDAANCGVCGNACKPTEVCDIGQCTCGYFGTYCPATGCANLASDNANCGACGHACNSGETCLDGACYLPSTAGLIGSANARWFGFAGDTLSPVHSAAYQRKWTHVASTTAADGTPLLLFYFREEGDAKLVSYHTDGTLVPITTDTFKTKWDHIVSPRMKTDYNLLFYSRMDGELKAVDARSSGAFVAIDSTILPPPDGSAPGAGTFKPARHAWDNVVPVKVPLGSGFEDALFVYHQVTGAGWFLIHHDQGPTGGWLWKVVNKHQLSRRWDEIAAGDFDGDGDDDLVFFDQDTGKLKLMFLDGDFDATSFQDLPSQGTAHTARLVAGNFDSPPGLVRADFLLYLSEGGDAFEDGRLTLWKDQANGTRVPGLDDTQALDGWTHLVPVDLGGGPNRQGLLMYSNQHVIDVTFYPMVSSWAGGPYTWTVANRRAAMRHQLALRKTYAAAGLAFDVKLNDAPGVLAAGAIYTCGAVCVAPKTSAPPASSPPANTTTPCEPEDTRCDASGTAIEVCNESGSWQLSSACDAGLVCRNGDRDAVNTWVTDSGAVPTTTLPIVLATEVDHGTGCSGLNAKFVRETKFYDDSGKNAYLVEGHSAHEIGHYFGLGHAHVGAAKDKSIPYDDAWVEKKLGAAGTIFTLDTDSRFKKDTWEYTYDTPATLTPRYWLGDDKKPASVQAAQTKRCPTDTFTPVLTFVNGNGDEVEMVLYPPTISAYGMCPGSYGYGYSRLSRDQVRAVRHTLYTQRKALIGL